MINYLNKFGWSIIKILFVWSLLIIISCTNTPYHRQQAEIFLNKGISYIELGQYNNALKDLIEAEKNYPDDHRIHYYLGLAYHGKGLKDQAIKEFEIAIDLKDNYSEAHNYLGTIYMDMGQWDKAIESFKKALANHLYDTPAIAKYNMGLALYSKKNYSEALQVFREVLTIDPVTRLRPQIEKNIGLIYYDQARMSDAIAHLKKSVELDSSLFDAHLLLGECYLRIQDNNNAKKSFQTVVKLSPDSSFGQRAKNHLKTIK